MSTATESPRTDAGAEMGQVFVDFDVVNSEDLDRAEDGSLAPGREGTLKLRGVRADTGASLLCLARHLVTELGLREMATVPVHTAAGYREARLFRNAVSRFEGRDAVVDVLELPDDAAPLLGALPMERLGIELDLQARSVRLLPLGPRNTFLTA
ncbi:MAG: aspartyl protease [Dehalococcoidia bacterium]